MAINNSCQLPFRVPGQRVSGIMMFKLQGSAVDNKRLMVMLCDALKKEASLWKSLAYKTPVTMVSACLLVFLCYLH